MKPITMEQADELLNVLMGTFTLGEEEKNNTKGMYFHILKEAGLIEEVDYEKEAEIVYNDIANSIVLDEFSKGKYNPIIEMRDLFKKAIEQLKRGE